MQKKELSLSNNFITMKDNVNAFKTLFLCEL